VTETPNEPNQSTPTPYSAPSAYPAPPGQPTPPAQPPVPSAPTYSAPSAYPIPVPPPAGHPGGYPTAVMPAAAYPTTGYPAAGYPSAPAEPVRRTSVWTWVLLGLSILLFLAAGGLGYGYYVAYTEVEDRNRRIGELQSMVVEQDGQIEQLQEDLAATEAELTDAQACVDAMERFIDLPPGSPDDEVDRVIDEMFDICGF
jgi:uncharacterized coiled-coil protein SlyX